MHNIDSQCLHTALLCFGAAIQWGNDIAGNPGLKECLVQGSGKELGASVLLQGRMQPLEPFFDLCITGTDCSGLAWISDLCQE